MPRVSPAATATDALPATPTDIGGLANWRRRRMEDRLAILLDRIEAQALALGSHRQARLAFVARAKAKPLGDPLPRLLVAATARRGEPGAR